VWTHPPGPWRRRLTLAALVPLAAASILAAPRPDPEKLRARYARYVALGDHLGFSLCGDSTVFMIVAEHPGMLLTPGFLYQSRPLVFATAHAVGRAATVVVPEEALRLAPLPGWWSPYLVLNAIVLVASIWLFDAAVAPPGARYPVTALLAALLLVNEVVRWFLCSPHTQLLIVLAPVLCLVLARSTLAAPGVMTQRRALVLGGTIGLLVLAYGAFLVCVPVVVIASMLRPATRRSGVTTALALFVVAATTPTLAWYAFVQIASGSVYSGEVAKYRQFVWPADAAASGRLLATASAFAREFAVTSASVLWIPLAILGSAVAVGWTQLRPAGLPPERRIEACAAVLTLACQTSFLYWLGFYRVRLSIGMVPPILALANVVLASAWPSLPTRTRRSVVAVLALVVAASVVHVLVEDPPA